MTDLCSLIRSIPLLHLITAILLVQLQVFCTAETPLGGTYVSSDSLTRASGPYAVTKDIIVNKGATLTIEPGVKLNFQARARLIVRGTLIARGSPSNPISMFHNATVGRDTGVIRLVGGNSVREGRIEVFNNHNWGTVCDDYWNSNNARVVCRQLGFGNPIEVSTRRFGPGSGTIGLSNVNCDGVENSLLDCRADTWNSSTCKHSEDVGVVCGEGSVGAWGGIVFGDDSVTGMTENNARKYYSNSVLENIEIMDAGIAIDTIRRSQPDLQVPVVTITTASPTITNVTLLRSRHIGVLLDTVHSDVKFTGLKIVNSTSSGITGSCSWQFTCSGCQLSSNGVSGIDLTGLPLLLEHPQVSTIQMFSLDYPSSTLNTQSFTVENGGCYVNFTSAARGRSYYTSAFQTTPGHGLSISFQRLRLNRNYLRLIDGVTGQQVLFWWSSNRNTPQNFSIPSHQLLFYIDSDYSVGTTGDILAYIAPYKLDARAIQLDSCTIRGAEFSNRLPRGIRLSGTLGDIQINNCHIVNTTNTGIQFSGSVSGIIMSSSTVSGTGSSTGLSVNVFLTSMALYDVKVEGYSYGMSVSISSQANVSISNSSFIRNRQRGAYVYWYQPYIYNWPLLRNQPLTITHCTFTDTASGYGLYVNVYNSRSAASRKVTISSNWFERNRAGLYYYHYYREITSEVVNNTFVNNTGGCCNGAMYLNSRFYYINYPQWTDIIDGNEFIGNSGEYVVKLFTSASFQSSYQLGPMIIFRNNNITDNIIPQSSRSSTSKSTPHAVVDIVGTVYVNAYYNIFNNPSASKELAVQAESTSSLDRVNVTLNWWGTANESEIHQRIFDFDDASRLAVANYFPFLLSPVLSDVAPMSHPRMYPSFIGANSEIGGQLATSVTLLSTGSPYTVTRDITVLPTGVLTIEAGTVLRFLPNVGMLVEGHLFSDGLLNQPVILMAAQTSILHPSTQDVHARLMDGRYYSTYAYGTLEVRVQGMWYTVCLGSEQPDYTSLSVLSNVACVHLGYESGHWSSNYWYPTLGQPIVRNFLCPYKASVLDDCSFNRSTYSPKSQCLTVVRVWCYRFSSYQQNVRSNWAGIRFSPTSSVPSSNGSHRVPKSRMSYTEIINAGQWTYKTVPAIQAIFRPPQTVGVTIRNSASTGLEVSYLHENAQITGVTVIGALGDGVSVRRPRGKNLTIDSIVVQNVSGYGIRVYRYTSALAANTDFQSICSNVPNITVDPEDGAYIGMSQDDHVPGIVCSVVLQGPPNTILSVRLVTLRLYNDDRLTIRNGPSSSSPSWRSYSGYRSSLADPFLSSGNAIYVEIATGAKTGAPGFSLHVEALSSAPREPFVHIVNSTVSASASGVYIGSLYDDTVIDNVSVTDSVNYGVYVSSQYGLLTISRNFIANSRNTGIYQSYGRKPMKFTDNRLVNNSRGMYIRPYYYYYDTCGVQVLGNVIVGSSREGIYANPDGYNYNVNNRRCPFDVSQNSFEKNNNGLLMSLYYQDRWQYSFNISHNSFIANNGTALTFDRQGDWHGTVTFNQFVYHRSKTGGSLLVQGTAQHLNVTDNTFQWNGGKYVVRLALLNFTAAPVVFSNNKLLNNYINETDRFPLDDRSAVVVLGLSDKAILTDNVLNNPESLYELGVELPVQSSSERILDVSRNYWGSTDENIIRDRIHDFEYCSRLASAQFIPYLDALGAVVSSTVPQHVGIIRPNSIIRGRVLADTVIPLSGSPYVVTGDISVLPGRQLTIEAGVELRFTHNTGILVEGQLTADGQEGAPIKMVDDDFLIAVREEGAIRIVGGPTKLEGRVEVFHNNSWGPVCVVQDPMVRYFRTNHDYYNTIVVCRELGHYVNYRFPFSDPSFGLSSQPAWLGHILCRGNEVSLKQCTNYVLQPSTCPYGQLVARCRDSGSGINNDFPLLHWTGLRFAESNQTSSIKHVVIERGGIANGAITPSVQVVGAAVRFIQLYVTGSAWTGVEVSNSLTVDFSQCSVSANRGSGVRLVNVPSSSVTALMSFANSYHGLALATDSILQRSWNIPVPADKIVDICSHSGLLSAATPFYLRFIADPTQRNYEYRTCTASILSDPQYVVSVHIMAVKFWEFNSYVTVDGRYLYRRRAIQSNFPLHYTQSQGSSVRVIVSAYLRDYSYELDQNYFLAYIQRHFTGLSSVTSHSFSAVSLTSNSISGLAINASDSSFERYDVSLLDSFVLGNTWNGIDINATSHGSSTSGSKVHTFDMQRNWITQNGNSTTATYGSRAAGVAMQIDKSNVIIQNSVIEDNRGGAVSLQLDSGSEHSDLYLFDNEIQENTAGPTVTVSGTSGTSGPRLRVTGNRISHNSAGILYDTLSISNVAANVSFNTFFNNTGRHVIQWTVGSRYSIMGQQCVDNTLYLNVGQTPNYRWSISADGVGPQYMRNILSNPSNVYEFVSGLDRGQGHQDARNNWWGTPYLNQAEQKVRDKSDQSSLATADIKPIDSNNPWASQSACPLGWVEFNSSCYLYVGGARTWTLANSYCQAIGSQLASSHSPSEDAFLQKIRISAISIGLRSAGVWLGLHGTENATWQWADFTSLDYTSWATSANANIESLCLNLDSTGWMPSKCELPLPFICKQAASDDCPNGCSQHGLCDKQSQTCSCDRGWKSSDCSEFHCLDVNHCSGYGTCVGPNQCRCRVGWKGRACTTTYCNLYTTCQACSQQAGCGWCDAQQECIPGLADKPDKQSCLSWFYYACYSPIVRSSSQCSMKIRDISCNSPCDVTVPTTSNETCQHCHDIQGCYQGNSSSCPTWNEDRCPYGRVTPDYGRGPDSPKIPSHLPFPRSVDSQPVKRDARRPHSDRRSSVDLFPDVRVSHTHQIIYRLLARVNGTSPGSSAEALFLTWPSIDLKPGRILSSPQCGGILDKVTSLSRLGTYQLIKTSPATLEEVIKYADFIEEVELKAVFHQSAEEKLPDADALQSIINAQTPTLEGAPLTHVIPMTVPVYKCVGNYQNGTFVIAMQKTVAGTLLLDNNAAIISTHSSGFIETVQSVNSSGGHTIVSTILADCTQSQAPAQLKTSVTTSGSPSVSVSPSVTGLGGDGRHGLLIYENYLSSSLQVTVGDTIVGRPSGPIAGYVKSYFDSVDGTYTYIELQPTDGIGKPACQAEEDMGVVIDGDGDLGPVVIGGGAVDIGGGIIDTSLPGESDADQGGTIAKNWCNNTRRALFSLHQIIRPQISSSTELTAELKVAYSPKVVMTLRSNHTSPFISKIGFDIDGPVLLGTKTKLNVNAAGSNHVAGATRIVGDHASPFCIAIGTICIPGRLLFTANFSFDIDYQLASLAQLNFIHEYESAGHLNLGILWRTSVGNQYHKRAELKTRQDNPRGTFTSTSQAIGRSASFKALLMPALGIEWPTTYALPDYIHATAPNFITAKVGSTSPYVSVSSSFSADFHPTLTGQWHTKECADGCDFDQKLGVDAVAGVDQVIASIDVDFRYVKSFESLQPWQSTEFTEVATGLCLKQTSPCSCTCPGNAPCQRSGGLNLCQPCSCTGSPSCLCSAPCPPGAVEEKDPVTGMIECKCRCSDFGLSSLGSNGTCQCGCTCNDGSESVIQPNGQCGCSCKCNNCEDSILGPSGCQCPNDICPHCPEGLEPVWQDCVCSCQSKQARGGLPPVCSAGWKGPYCDVPDCSPWPFCSDNGNCTIPSGDDADKLPYCICEEQWLGAGCHIARPRPGGGDPHLQTLDGISYDFFDIGEFWYCKSQVNDFGMATRFFKYERVSLIGAVALKVGFSVVTITTPSNPTPTDLPNLRINGVLMTLTDGLMKDLADDTVHLETVLFSNKSSVGDGENSGSSVALIAFQYASGVSVTIDVRYSAGMKRQFVNILFSPTASFKKSTEGLCGYMDGDKSNDLVGSDGVVYQQANILNFAKSWRINATFGGSGLNGTWSWNHSNFHKNDLLDASYTDPNFVPLYDITTVRSEVVEMARSVCLQLGLTGVRLDECIFDVAVTNDTSLADQETFQIGCPTQCSGKGRCVNSSCVCLPGWFGDDCSRGSCANCSINGNCVSGFCQCNFGWEGPYCDRPATCLGVSNCTSPLNGLCKAHDVCECSAGFIGINCSERALCINVNDCSGRGVCIDHDTCKCQLGWAGINCSVFSCEVNGHCSGHGSCVAFDVCQCDVGWGGSSCALPLCTALSHCSGNGDCTAPDVCSCYSGYSGKDCATPDSCPQLNDCSSNGVCVSEKGKEMCRCFPGYSDPNCSKPLCAGRNECSGHGQCIEVDLCQCDYGYTEADCSGFSCELHQFCSGHGRCLSFDQCTCDKKWSGSACQIPDCSKVNNCSNAVQGTCIGPDVCLCSAQYDEDDCSVLAGPNSNRPVFNNSVMTSALASNSPVGSQVITVSASDQDRGKNGRLSYTMTSSNNDHLYFRINGSTGEITTVKLVSDKKGGLLFFKVIATDKGIPPLSGSLELQLDIVPPNQYCPTFKGLPPHIVVSDLAVPGTSVVNVTATDDDGTSTANGIVAYSLSSSGHFSIDSGSGEVVTQQSLTADAYSLTVTASDGGSPQCSTTATVLVRLHSNNTVPVCNPSTIATSLAYDVPVGTVIFELSAVDPDNGSDGRLTYYYSNFKSTFLRNLSPFRLVQNSGIARVHVISFLMQPSGSNPVFYDASFRVTVRDAAVRPKSCSYFVSITVTRQFQFENSTLFARLRENVPRGTVVSTTPPLRLLTNVSGVIYELYNADGLPFSVDAATGKLMVSASLNYETMRSYNVSVVAKTDQIPGAFAVASVVVTVEDVNDNPPRFPYSRYTVYIEETAAKGTTILSLTATDADSVGGPVDYTVTSPGAENVFVVTENANGGVDVTLAGDGLLNYQMTPVYGLVIKATDTANPRLFMNAHVRVVVEAVNFTIPAFLDALYRSTILENTPNGETVTAVSAVVNGRPSAEVSYRLASQRSSSGRTIDAFRISQSGQIQVSQASLLDYESIKQIDLSVVASLRTPLLRTAQTTVVVTLNDVNDNYPRFSTDHYTGKITPDDPVGTAIVTLNATDRDSGSNAFISFKLVDDGKENQLFTLVDGVVTLAAPLNESTLDSYVFSIEAYDGGQPSLTSTTSVEITVQCSDSGRCPWTSQQDSGSGVPFAAVIGGAVGGAIFITLVVIIVVVFVRKSGHDHDESIVKASRDSKRSRATVTDYHNPLYSPQSGGNEGESSYESLDDSRKTSTSPLTQPASEMSENQYLEVGDGKSSTATDYTRMKKSFDDVPDMIYEDMDGKGRQEPLYSNVNTRL